MPLESVKNIMLQAQKGQYAVGYFESWNLESLQAVLDAAEETQSPVIVGFNGEFLCHEHRTLPERLELYGALGQAAARASKVPCGFIFNECCYDEWLRKAVTAGFNLIMPSNEKSRTLREYQEWVVPLTRYAHEHGIAVEAEVGMLPCGQSDAKGEMTDPIQAADFVKETGVDLLAVSAGNVHIMTHGKQALDLEHLAKIQKHVSVPLVLHGGTGIDDQSLQEAIALGVAKVNFGTNLKMQYLETLRTGLSKGDAGPHQLLGMGGQEDLMVACRRAVRDVIVEKMKLLGCCGKGA